MKNAQPPVSKEPSATNDLKFTGPETLRQGRLLAALLEGPLSREQVDRIAGASNGPQVVLELRRLGLDIPCERVPCVDRDGAYGRRGSYSLTVADRLRLAVWGTHHLG